MSLLTRGKRHKVVAEVYTESQERPRGIQAVIEACDVRPLYVYNEFLRPKSIERPVEYPLNVRQMKAVREYQESLREIVIEKLAMAQVGR